MNNIQILPKKTTRGFTLIEVLVVVLIIAVLASIAWPKYVVALERNRALEAINMTHAIGQAASNYYMTHDVKPTEIQDLGIVFSGTSLGSGVYASKYYVYNLVPASALYEIAATRINPDRNNVNTTFANSLLVFTYIYRLQDNPDASYKKLQLNKVYCAIQTKNSNLKPWHKQVCQSYGKKVTTLSNGWEYYSP